MKENNLSNHFIQRYRHAFIKEYAYDWAAEINEVFKRKIYNGDHQPLIRYEKLHKAATLAIPTPGHYDPLLYTLGLQGKNEGASIFHDKLLADSLNMTLVKIGAV